MPVHETKRLNAMRRAPQGDWRIADVEKLCSEFDVRCLPPRRGDHYKIAHASQVEILTIPAHRPIKPVYIRKLVKFIDDVVASRDDA